MFGGGRRREKGGRGSKGVLTFVTGLSGIVQWCSSLNVLGVGGDPHIEENTDTLAVAHGCRPMKWSSVRQ